MAVRLALERVSKSFRLPGWRGGMLPAVIDVSLAIGAGETVALVGESGSGKTTLGRIAVGLLRPDAGSVRAEGGVQMVFQDSAAALNPRRSVGESVMLPLLYHRGMGKAAARAAARALLERVGLGEEMFERLPRALSGGQRQRVGIARALASEPAVLVADEPVSALDVSVRAQVLRLFAGLRDEFGLATLFITHDLGVVRAIAGRVVVMYRGRVVEEGAAADVLDLPLHPYTQALRAATPVPDPGRARQAVVRAPEAAALPGCAFRARCPAAMAECSEVPVLRGVGRRVACHAVDDPDEARGRALGKRL